MTENLFTDNRNRPTEALDMELSDMGFKICMLNMFKEL